MVVVHFSVAGCVSRIHFINFVVLASVLMSGVACETMPVVDRRAEQSGLHRVLISKISLPSIFNPGLSTVSVTLVEHIPSGMYIDLHQLQIEQLWGAPRVLSQHNFDVEKPESVSVSHSLLVFVEVTKNAESSTFQGEVRLPIHLRYHDPRQAGKNVAKILLPSPKLLVRVDDLPKDDFSSTVDIEESPCDHANSTRCSWRQLKQHTDTHPLEFELPVGRKDDQILVICGTTAVTVLASLVLSTFMLK